MKFCWILYANFNIWQINSIVFCFCFGNTKYLYFISALPTQWASLKTTCQLLHMLCLVIAFQYLMQFQNDYSVILLLCSSKIRKSCDFECVKDRYQCCVIFACFSSCVLGVFDNPAARSAHGLHEFSPSLRLWFISETRACLLCIVVPPS